MTFNKFKGRFSTLSVHKNTILVLASFLLSLSGFYVSGQTVVGESIESNCNYLFKKLAIQTAQDSNAFKSLYKECENCCKLIGNDSLLLRLYLMDSLTIFSDKEFYKNLVEENNKNGAQAYCKTLSNSYSKTAYYYSRQNVDTALQYYREANALQKKCNDLKGYATSLQNIAFAYDEKKNKPGIALQYAFESLTAWNVIKDTFGVANMCKYIGYLMGREGNFKQGAVCIDKAISLFTLIGFEQGIAVSYYDMALLQVEKKNEDSALYYLLRSKSIWKKYNDYFRIFKINNALLEVYNNRASTKLAGKVLNENLKLSETSSKIIASDKRKFYELAAAFYHRKKDILRERELRTKRNNILD